MTDPPHVGGYGILGQNLLPPFTAQIELQQRRFFQDGFFFLRRFLAYCINGFIIPGRRRILERDKSGTQ